MTLPKEPGSEVQVRFTSSRHCFSLTSFVDKQMQASKIQ
jgi:hypothetical protein